MQAEPVIEKGITMTTKDRTEKITPNPNDKANNEAVQKIRRLELVPKRENREDGLPVPKPVAAPMPGKDRSPRKHPKAHMPNEFEGMRKWTAIPLHFRQKILDNIFCGKCGCTSMVDYLIEDNKLGIVLRGKCNKCGGIVARFVEDE